MKFYQTITLKNGKEAILRNGDAADGEAVLEVFIKTHEETDYLLTYPEENTSTPEEEAEFLSEKTESENGIEIIAIVDEKVVGTAGIGAHGTKYKEKHRADFGISVLKEYWGLGLGTALTRACIECAREAGYAQLELSVVADNEAAVSLYRKEGFVEYGRNPKGFNSRISGYQEVIDMLLDLE
ncbi:MAG: GNAT family N-acetyltransferase [Lachnospiraceae bacterium]|nr:GNAT family N-acetyltransferase [Lachnospiraceae bacterium]